MNKFSNCVKIQFEIGHEATLRSEVTPQGFTHDWQVFVRGVDNAEIRHFVEKVVFNLHQSFPKPKRVVKEPPYEVRESGYASFTFPIEVYLKSKDDQKKLEFIYDLTLSPTGPVRSTNCEKRILKNPSEDFRRKLLRGGGITVGDMPLADNNSQSAEDKSSLKKCSSDSSKKHKSKDSNKPEEPRTSSQFADLFGTPIKTAKLSPTTAPKKSSDSKHSSDYKVSSKSTKHSPHKDREKEATKKSEAMISTSSSKEKDKDKVKEKDKKSEKSLKRPPSPALPQPPTKTIKEDVKKSNHEELKDKVKLSNEVDKSEKREKKRDKKIRDEKDRRDRHKDHENKKELPAVPPPPQPPPAIDKEKEKNIERLDKTKGEFKEFKDNVKRSPRPLKEDKLKDKVEKETKVVESSEKPKHKHHKKKDKNKKDEKDKDKEKSSKKTEKPPALTHVPKEPSPPHTKWPRSPISPSPSPKQNKNSNPISMLMSEMKDTDPSEKDSESDSSADETSKYVEKVKRTSPQPPPPPPVLAQAIRSPEHEKEEKFIKDKTKKKDKKSSFKDEDGSRKRKRKNKDIEDDAPEKISKLKEIDEPKTTREESLDDDMDDRVLEHSITASPSREDQEISRSRSPTPTPKFTEEYVEELKDLQKKIMTLEDNAELQRVVQVIAETGQYEITKKTFDFDLCALDKSTVKRLQDLFFAAS